MEEKFKDQILKKILKEFQQEKKITLEFQVT